MTYTSAKMGIVTRDFLPRIGGISLHTYFLSRELMKRRHEVTVYTAKRHPQHSDEEWIDGLHVKRFNCFTLSPNHRSDLSLSLFASLLRDDLSLIHAHDYGWFGLVAYVSAFLRRVPYFLTVHYFDPPVGDGDRGAMTQIFTRIKKLLHLKDVIRDFLVGRARCVFCVSPNIAKALAGIRKEGVYYVPNGVDLGIVDSIVPRFRESHGLKSRILLLNVGRICKIKGQVTLVKAFPLVLEEFPNAILVLAGPVDEPEYYARIVNEMKRSGVEKNVLVLNGVGIEQVMDLYKSCDALVLTSTYEGMPLTIPEAWAAGIPVITSAIDNIKEIVKDKENVLLYPAQDHVALAERIVAVLSDRELSNMLSENGRKESTQRYSWSRIAEEIESHYCKSADSAESARRN